MTAHLEAVADAPIAYDVVDVLGFAQLAKRTPTLDGSVPVRVAQACVPLLAGNAWGHQIVLPRIQLRRRFGSWTVEIDDERARLLAASLPVLVAAQLLVPDGYWQRRLARGLVDTRGAISIFTGLFVRPRAGTRIRVSSTANRRAWTYTIAEAIYDDPSALVPLILEVVPATSDTFVLEGEVATVAAVPAPTPFVFAELADAPDVARAHVAFYDAHYFETKQRGEASRKYRDGIAREQRAPASGSTLVVQAGPLAIATATPARVLRANGPANDTTPDRLVVRSAIAFTAAFDGARVTVTPDAEHLAAYARDVRAAWEPWLAASSTAAHHGALLYLTKYFTPHPPGEPHFFVKPSALVKTPDGVSTVIDGVHGPGYDVLRGVVRTDGFHAAPSVFHVRGEIAVPRGTPLCELFPCPRSLIDAPIEHARAGLAARWS